MTMFVSFLFRQEGVSLRSCLFGDSSLASGGCASHRQMLKTTKVMVKVLIIAFLKGTVWQPTQEVLFPVVFQAQSLPHVVFRLFFKNIKRQSFPVFFFFFPPLHSKLYMYGKICSSIPCPCTCPS